MFITFEGIDGSGKSTQIERLGKKLAKEGYRVEVFREPGGTEVSEKVRALLLDSDLEIHPVTELLLFSAARAQLMSERVLPLLEEGTFVILDRFYDSTTAYQGYGRNSATLEQINSLNAMASQKRSPDITFYLRIGLADARQRMESAARDRMERSSDDFYEKVIRGFDALAEKEDRIIQIDSALPPGEVHKMIWDRVTSHLDGN